MYSTQLLNYTIYFIGELERGQHVTVQKGNLAVTVWKDKRLVYMMSTNANPDKTVGKMETKKYLSLNLTTYFSIISSWEGSIRQTSYAVTTN